MKLDVIQSGTDAPWFAEGLTFTCQQCGNCCTGGPGYVWITDEEINRLAALLRVQRDEVIAKYCRRIGQRYSLNERRTPQGLYDCVFLRETRLKGGGVKRTCSIYAARPLQCRTWPFWPEHMSAKKWSEIAEFCPGVGKGPVFEADHVQALLALNDS